LDAGRLLGGGGGGAAAGERTLYDYWGISDRPAVLLDCDDDSTLEKFDDDASDASGAGGSGGIKSRPAISPVNSCHSASRP
jgi:hypothetical protein